MTMLAWALPFEFDQPVWLWLGLLIPVMVVASLRSLAGLDPLRRVLSLAARSVVIILIVICLAGIQSVKRNDDLTVLFLMDRSDSVQTLQTYQEEWIRESAENKPPHDRVGLIDFSRYAFVQQLPDKAGYHLPAGRLPMMPDKDRTDAASAVSLAMAMFPHDTAKRMVLITDGNDNLGDLITEARRAKADGIPIDVVPLWYQHTNEVYFDRMIAPTHAEKGEQVPLRMVLNTQRRVSGTIEIYQNDRLIELPQEQTRVELAPGNNTFFMKLPVTDGGAQTYEAIFRPDDRNMDNIPLNNSATAFSFVSGVSKVLIISGNPEQDAVLAEALAEENIDVELRTAAELGSFDLLHMQNYSTIVLANIPASTFTDKQQEELAVYVRDLGSGLIMLGGDDSFGAGGWIGSPVEDVMPVTFEIMHKKVIPRGALVLIMHSCEVARGNYWGKQMAKKSIDTVSSRDYVGVLAFSYSPMGVSWEVPLTENANKAAVKARIDRMQIGDMPDFAQTMQMAHKELTAGRGADAAQKHVIILSDGDANPPSSSLLRDYKTAGITVSTIAIGWGAHVRPQTMRDIAKRTGGRFYEARNPRALPQIFMKESKVVRRSLLVEQDIRPDVYHRHTSLMAGFDGADVSIPMLHGMVLTTARNSPDVQMPLVRITDDPQPDPILAHWQCGLGKSVAFTSGLWHAWGSDWTAWSSYSKLWAQVVRWTLRQESPANFETFTKIDGGTGRIVVDALDKDASYLNFLNFTSRLVTPDRESKPLEFTQTGPGHYEATFDADKAGQYLAHLQVREGGKYRGTIRTGLSVPFSPEYRELHTNEALLRQIVDITGGRFLDGDEAKAEVFTHDLPPTEAKQDVWAWVLAWLLLPLFLLDVAVRRLASAIALSIVVEILILAVLLGGLQIWMSGTLGILGALVFAELVGWTIRFRSIGPIFAFLTHGVTAMARTGERSEESLGKLKDTRDRVRGEMNAGGAEPLARLNLGKEAREASYVGRTFDAGEDEDTGVTGSLDEVLGGAQASGAPADKTRKPAPSDGASSGGDAESATERLLRAKRRAREDQDKT